MGNIETPRNVTTLILGALLSSASLKGLVAEAMEAVESRARQLVFACANVHSLILARSDPAFREALAQATHLVPDGIGVLLAARARGGFIGPRITGYDYFRAVCRALAARGHGRIYFLGSTDEVLARISRRFASEYPNLEVCGSYSPPYEAWEPAKNKTIVDGINAARPDVLWVGMTAPKQEKWIHENRALLSVPVVGAIGAVFDFYAGTKRRAPEWMCRCGLEWVYRFLREPHRMWRRHLISIPKFVFLVIWEQFTIPRGEVAKQSCSSRQGDGSHPRHGEE
jgi:N-acetylglucosaminyldiphosphoundecaprenol N-acetyl-beta-D-mannosaminyltransferase